MACSSDGQGALLVFDRMKNTTTGSHSAEIDLVELLARVDNDHDLLCRLFDIFKNDAPAYMDRLRQAIVRQDVAKVATEAHTLKGMLCNLSCKQAAAAAADLEKLAREGRASDFAMVFASLQLRIKKLIREMET